jgi:hypothetical protein
MRLRRSVNDLLRGGILVAKTSVLDELALRPGGLPRRTLS